MKAVLFITRKWPPAVGGMETYGVELSQRLETATRLRRHVLPGRADGSPPGGLRLTGFGLSMIWRLLTSSERFDVVHGGDMAIWPLIWFAGALRIAPRLVLSAHGTDVALGTRTGPVAAAYAAYLRLGARMLRNVRVLANSEATASLARGFGFGDVRVVRLAATSAGSAQAPAAPEPYIAFVGRLIPSKGCAWFIREVLPGLPRDVRLKVAGTINDASEGAALRNGRVDFLGPRFGEDLARLRRGAIAVVAPNLLAGSNSFEGFGLTAVEAAADGGVVVAARAHGVADAVIDGVTGFLELPGDAGAWTRRIVAIRAWTPSERAAFIKGAATAVAAHYSWDRVAAETLAAYQDGVTPGR